MSELIECPACGNQVSKSAPACVKCGHPMQAQTVEATGKKFKIMQLIGALMILFGFVGVISTPESATISISLFVIGLALFGVGRIGAWWYHG